VIVRNERPAEPAEPAKARLVEGQANAGFPPKARVGPVPVTPDQHEFSMQDVTRHGPLQRKQEPANGSDGKENKWIANVKGAWASIPMQERRAFVAWIFKVTPELRP
jgi:hypothetical protein